MKLRKVGEAAPKLGRWPIQGTVYGLTVIYGEPGTMKTFLAMSMAVAVASGKPWFGKAVHQGPVIYIVGEGGMENTEMRLQAATREAGVKSGDDFELYQYPQIDIKTPGSLEDVWPEWDSIGPHLVIVDTVSRCMVGDENKQEDMRAFVGSLDAVQKRYGCAVIAIHHKNKGTPSIPGSSTIRGSTVLPGAADVMIELTRKEGQKELYLRAAKLKDLDTDDFCPPMLIGTSVPVVDSNGLYVYDDYGDKFTTLVLREPPDAKAAEDTALNKLEILAATRPVDQAVGYREWETASGMTKARFKRAISGLLSSGKAKRVLGPGHYTLGENECSIFTPGDNYQEDADQDIIAMKLEYEEYLEELARQEVEEKGIEEEESYDV